MEEKKSRVKLPDITIEIDGVTFENSYSKDIYIDRSSLEDEIEEQTSLYAFYSHVSNIAQSACDAKKIKLERMYAVLDHQVRQTARSLMDQDKKIKFTEKMYEGEVTTKKEYRDLQDELLASKLLAAQLASAAKAMFMRKDMLTQLFLQERRLQLSDKVINQYT